MKNKSIKYIVEFTRVLDGNSFKHEFKEKEDAINYCNRILKRSGKYAEIELYEKNTIKSFKAEYPNTFNVKVIENIGSKSALYLGGVGTILEVKKGLLTDILGNTWTGELIGGLTKENICEYFEFQIGNVLDIALVTKLEISN